MGKTHEQIELSSKGLRKCRICKEIKPTVENFHLKRNYLDDQGNVRWTTYNTRCKSCYRDWYREWRTSSPSQYCKCIIAAIKNRAKTLNLPFDLDWEHLFTVWKNQDGKCYYSGVTLDLSHQLIARNAPHPLFPSLDRQIPELGYTKGNTIWCTSQINRMKDKLTHHQFVEFCHTVANRF